MNKKIETNMLETMVDKQFTLNSNMNGIHWIFGKTTADLPEHEKVINWGRTIYMEVLELIESYPWKHWADLNAITDKLNVKIELADIWHFILSLLIEYAFSQYFEAVKKENKGLVITRETVSADQIQDMWDSHIKHSVVTYFEEVIKVEEENKSTSKIIRTKYDNAREGEKEFVPFEELAISAMILSTIANHTEETLEQKMGLVVSVITIFHTIINEYVEIDLELIYMGKTVLNQFRQDHGYKKIDSDSKKNYKKLWNFNGEVVEDNVVMFSFLKEGITDKELYILLEQSYKA